MNKLQQVRSKIIKAVPEIMDLKFGCYYNHKGLKDFNGMILGSVAADVYYAWRFGDEGSGVVPNNLILEKDEITEILGRPIRLADVLIAVWSHLENYELPTYESAYLPSRFTIASDGDMFCDLPKAQIANWNLHKDSLDDQSEDTINFLHSILC